MRRAHLKAGGRKNSDAKVPMHAPQPILGNLALKLVHSQREAAYEQ